MRESEDFRCPSACFDFPPLAKHLAVVLALDLGEKGDDRSLNLDGGGVAMSSHSAPCLDGWSPRLYIPIINATARGRLDLSEDFKSESNSPG